MTLTEILDRHASERPDNMAYVFLRDDGQRKGLSFSELARRARAIAAQLQERGLEGQRAVLQYPPGLDFIEAILACFYAGVVAVPALPVRNRRELPRLAGIMRDCGSRVVLTNSTAYAAARPLYTDPALDQIPTSICTDEVPDAAAAAFKPVTHDPSSLCFLQYTSGSTGRPKGVMVTHRNLLHNQQMIKSAFGHDDSTIFVGWLPLYHDMGLIGNVFQPLYLGILSVLFAPMSFLASPVRWLQAISEWRATTSGAPSFAYELCVHRVSAEDMAGLDLSSWQVAYNGAEPVKARVIDAFIKKFSPVGFRETAFYPCYGMAEATLFVTGGEPKAPVIKVPVDSEQLAKNVIVEQPESSTTLVGCGTTHGDQRVRVVDPESLRVLPDGQIGEIWISGDSVASGYWGRPEETAATFQARTAEGEGPFLRTGDLGFLRRGECFITGRLKDLIIIRGRNHYPDDIESTVCEAHEALRPGGAAAFAIEGGEEAKLVVVAEVHRTFLGQIDAHTRQAILIKARKRVSDIHGLRLAELVLIKPGTLPKTSSGKIRRRHCCELYRNGELSLIEVSAAREVNPGATSAA